MKGVRKKREKSGRKVAKICRNSTKLSKSAHLFANSMQKFDIFVF